MSELMQSYYDNFDRFLARWEAKNIDPPCEDEEDLEEADVEIIEEENEIEQEVAL